MDNYNFFYNICEKVRDKISLRYVKLDIYSKNSKKPTILNTKLGGLPYIPTNFQYPFDKNLNFYGERLVFLAQINFEEIPQMDYFPDKGILQFYIASNYLGAWGMNSYDKLNIQDSFRVIYHEKIDYCISKNSCNNIPLEKELPFKGEFFLKPTICEDSISCIDYRFKDLIIDELNKYNKKLDENLLEQYKETMIEIHSFNYISIGGYPNFIQDDFRNNDLYNNYCVKLLEIPSIINDDINLSWGDNGVANFTINKVSLKNLDFSNVCFQWQSY